MDTEQIASIENLAYIFEDVLNEQTWGQLVEIHFVYLDTPAEKAGEEWLRKHGLDPLRITKGSLVTRNPFTHQIIYQETLVGLDPADENNEMVFASITRIEQNEAGPYPYPEEILNEQN